MFDKIRTKEQMGVMIFSTLYCSSIIESSAVGTVNRIKAKSRSELSLVAVLYVLADPMRLEIVRRLHEAGKQLCTFGSCQKLGSINFVELVFSLPLGDCRTRWGGSERRH
jgi:hypothetical protein